MPDRPLPSVDELIGMLALALDQIYNIRPGVLEAKSEEGKLLFTWSVGELARRRSLPAFMLQQYESFLPRQPVIQHPGGLQTELKQDEDAPPDEEAPPDDRRRGLAPCILDILATLREAGEPLTKIRLQEEMEKRRRIWGERTVEYYLKVLMDDGTIENPKDARPRGYRLPGAEKNKP